MYLTPEEEKILNGEEGESKRKAMEILVALGRIFKAERLIPIESAQIAGVSYKSIGEAGLRWLKSMKDARVIVPSTLNPAGMDLVQWRLMGIDEDFARKQNEIIEIFRQIGVYISCTCIPYFSGNLPRFGSHIAWSESSAVCYANSVIGARTNREGGPSALAAAIIGKTPLYGLHIDENRKANQLVKVLTSLKQESDYGALGYLIGKELKSCIPFFKGIRNCSLDGLKALGAALAAAGNISMYHIEGVTPEAKKAIVDKIEKIDVDVDDIKRAYEELTTGSPEDVDLITIGCPHASLSEIRKVAEMISGKKVRRNRKLWIFTSIAIKEIADRSRYTAKIERAGGRVLTDCCMVVAPIEKMNFRTVATNSAKAAVYLPSMSKVDVVFCKIEDCIRIAVGD